MMWCKNIFQRLSVRIIVLAALVCLTAVPASAQLARPGLYEPQGWGTFTGSLGGYDFGSGTFGTNNGNFGFGNGTSVYTGGTANSVTTDDGHTTVVQGQGTGSSAYKDNTGNPPYNGDNGGSNGSNWWDNLVDSIKNVYNEWKDKFSGVWKEIYDFISNEMNEVAEMINSFIQEDNKDCAQPIMDEIYHNGCYACKVMKSLLSAFLNGCKKLEDVSKEAGQKILLLGAMLWIAFYIMKQVSSMKNIEPGAMINDILMMLFRILIAWFAIIAGFKLAVDFILVPFLSWGAEFGSTLAQSIAAKLNVSAANQAAGEYLVTSSEGFLPAKFLNDIMTLVSSIDGVTSQHMKLGHMLICHSTHAGSWYVMPNPWTWICGALIWCAGFFMTLTIMFFLVDVSFKLSLSLVALPIVAGLWPFKITGDRFVACIKMILNAAGIMIFLALTCSVAMVLVDKALTFNTEGGIAELYKAIEDGDTDLISSKISLMSVGFILLIFAYFYGIKVIGTTVKEYVQAFFPDSALGNQNPMHEKMVGKLAMIKTQANKMVSFGEDAAKHQISQGLEKGGRKIGKFVRKTASRIIHGGKGGGGGTGGGGGAAGNVASTAGSGMQATGSVMSTGGKVVKAGTKAAATGMNAVGSGAAGLGDALAPVTFGASSVVGHGVQAGAQAGAAAVETVGNVAGEAMEKTGEAVKQAGKAVKQTGEMAKQASKSSDEKSSGRNNND